MSIWLIFCLVVVAVVIVTIVFRYMAAPIDTRETHSKIIFASVYDCLVSNGYLTDSVFKQDFDLEKICLLNTSILETDERGFLQVKIMNLSNYSLENYIYGASSLAKTCSIGIKQDELFCFSKKDVVNFFNASNSQEGQLVLVINMGMKDFGKSMPSYKINA